MRYVFLLLLQFFLNYNTLAKETVSDEPLSIYLDSLKKLQRDYQITGYNLYKFLGKNSPVRNYDKKKIDKYFGINTELLGTLDLIINKKEYPSLYLATKEPFFPSDFWGDSYNNFDEESASEEPFYPFDFWRDSQNDSDEDEDSDENTSENHDHGNLSDEEQESETETLVAENSADSNQQNSAVSVNGAQQSENSEEEDEESEDEEENGEDNEDVDSDENDAAEEENGEDNEDLDSDENDVAEEENGEDNEDLDSDENDAAEEENGEDNEDADSESDESDENAGNEGEETQLLPVAVVNPQDVAVINPQDVAVINPQDVVVIDPQDVAVIDPQPDVAVNPQFITATDILSDDADEQSDDEEQISLPLMENSQQYQGDVFSPTNDLPATNQLLPSLDENFQQYQGVPNNGLLGRINIESAGFQNDNGNWENQKNSNQDQLGNFLRKAQLAKNTFIGDLDRYGNAYDDEYYGQYQGNSNRRRRQPEIESASMNSDNINSRESDFINESQVFGENQEENSQLQDDSVTHSDDSSNVHDFDEDEDNDEVQPAAADNDLPNSEPAENSSAEKEEEDNDEVQPAATDNNLPNSEPAESSSAEEENTSAEENSANDTDAADSPADSSANDENINADADEEDDEEAESTSNDTAPIAQQTEPASSFAPQPERFGGQVVPQTQMPQPRMPQQNLSLPRDDQPDYEADSELYDDSNPSENSSENLQINSQNTQISDSDVKTQPVSDEENSGNNYVPSEMTESKISNHEDRRQPSSRDSDESTDNEMSTSDPQYLNEFDQFADSQPQDSVISEESEMSGVQAPKKSDDEPTFIVPDTSDGKLHINHF